MTNLDKSLLEKINAFQWDVLSQLSEYKSLGDLAVGIEFDEEEAPKKKTGGKNHQRRTACTNRET